MFLYVYSDELHMNEYRFATKSLKGDCFLIFNGTFFNKELSRSKFFFKTASYAGPQTLLILRMLGLKPGLLQCRGQTYILVLFLLFFYLFPVVSYCKCTFFKSRASTPISNFFICVCPGVCVLYVGLDKQAQTLAAFQPTWAQG